MSTRIGLRSSRLNLVFVVGAVVLSGSTVEAQTIKKGLTRSFNDCPSQAPYIPDATFFTATGAEAVLTLSRTLYVCPTVCKPLPSPPYSPGETSCNHFCGPSDPCPAGLGLVCPSTGSPLCIGGVNIVVGYVAVIKTSRYCSIAACGSAGLPPGCPPSACDGSGTCSESSDVKALCLCPDPACPINQRLCDATRPTIPPGDLVFEAFGGASDADWVLGQATIGSTLSMRRTADLPTILAQVRFPTTPGEEYVLHMKWTISPITSGFLGCPDASLLLSLESRPDTCGP